MSDTPYLYYEYNNGKIAIYKHMADCCNSWGFIAQNANTGYCDRACGFDDLEACKEEAEWSLDFNPIEPA